jgi:hypothetical protein
MSFTSLPLVHTLNPDFLGLQLWLCFSRDSWMSPPETSELGLLQIPEVALTSQQVRACPRAWAPNRVFIRFPNRQISEIRTINSWDSGLPHVHDSASSPNRTESSSDSRILHIREFGTSQVPDFRESRVPCSWKTYFENSVKLDVSRVTGFPEFPNSDVVQLNFHKKLTRDSSHSADFWSHKDLSINHYEAKYNIKKSKLFINKKERAIFLLIKKSEILESRNQRNLGILEWANSRNLANLERSLRI